LEGLVFSVVRYCVQPFSVRAGNVVREEPLQFREREGALSEAQALARRFDVAAVYEVTGWPVQDLWDRPKLIARFGGDGQLGRLDLEADELHSVPVRFSVLAISMT
jgi:hypothetical protein